MKLFLTALGIINALGVGKRKVADNLFSAEHHALTPRDDLIPGTRAWVGCVEDRIPELPSPFQRYNCSNNRFAFAALQEISTEVEEALGRYGHDRVAVVLGTSTAGIAEGEFALAQRLEGGVWPAGYNYSQQEPGNLAAFVADLLGIRGPAYTVHTACSSSGKAFAAAARLIRSGFCDAALVGGVDSLCRLTLNGFNSLEALAPMPCNPFSRNRCGTSIGEGGAIFLLEPAAGPIQLLGVGESSDAYHVSAPDPSGAGARLAMERALTEAGLGLEDISYINLHGTATPLNDLMEAKAMASLFGTRTPCSSTKSLTGHTLGAAAATEAGLIWITLAARQGTRLPPHIWDSEWDPEIPRINLVGLHDLVPAHQPLAMLSNSFAFGGSNVSLILGSGYEQ